MGRFLDQAILDKTTENSGWRIRRLEEGAVPVKRLQYKKEANAAANAILRKVDEFLKASWNDPDSEDKDNYHSRSDYIHDQMEEYYKRFHGEFVKELDKRLTAIIAAKYKT